MCSVHFFCTLCFFFVFMFYGLVWPLDWCPNCQEDPCTSFVLHLCGFTTRKWTIAYKSPLSNNSRKSTNWICFLAVLFSEHLWIQLFMITWGKKHSPMKKVTVCDSSCCVGFRYFMAFLLSSSAKCFMNISSTSSAKFITCLIHEKLIRRTFNHFTYVHKILAPDTRQIMPDKCIEYVLAR